MGSNTAWAVVGKSPRRRFGDYLIDPDFQPFFGGAAVVYRARHIDTGTVVALKVLWLRHPGDHPGDPAMRQDARLKREWRLLASIDSPNVVRVYDYGEDDQCRWMALQWVAGGTLSIMLQAHNHVLPKTLICVFGVQIALGLRAVHDLGMVYRDLKPANILIDEHDEDHLILADFGIARGPDDTQITLQDHTVGTPGYMSPEQIRGEYIDSRSDLYSLGCILYEMIAGRQVFIGDQGSVLRRHLHIDAKPPIPLRTFRPDHADIPTRLIEIVMKLLEGQPGNRYQSAAQLVYDLSKFLDTREVTACGPLATQILEPLVSSQPSSFA